MVTVEELLTIAWVTFGEDRPDDAIAARVRRSRTCWLLREEVLTARLRTVPADDKDIVYALVSGARGDRRGTDSLGHATFSQSTRSVNVRAA